MIFDSPIGKAKFQVVIGRVTSWFNSNIARKDLLRQIPMGDCPMGALPYLPVPLDQITGCSAVRYSALDLGSSGRGFKSHHPDHFCGSESVVKFLAGNVSILSRPYSITRCPYFIARSRSGISSGS